MPIPMTTHAVHSRDGTRIGYSRSGDGPGLVLLHGALQTSRSFSRLAAELSDNFTIYVPDRRGRGLSGPPGDSYGMQAEVDDLAALLEATGAHHVFGLSSGALIALQAATNLPAVRKLAIYEPPLEIDGKPSPQAWMPAYESELADGNLAAAMVAIIKGVGDPSMLPRLPRFVFVPMIATALWTQSMLGDRRYSLRRLIPTMQFDIALVREMAGRVESFRALDTPTLLMAGTSSTPFLLAAVDALEDVLPNCQRVDFAGLGHLAADDSGEPARVADVLREYFSQN
ncbi:alpha/beta hydrolase [Starkeya sp. ORNL1]|uniref:alpha/beta fold hydrolase n=1 Tax=Starkeya sp. ORNL1 TaxID=2709380 RepID=UPI001980189F|nr:alpha/beta hydrolase [Starkeya sp. ORNL1]